MILAKQAFEQFAANRGITQIKAYHVDNGIFKANQWVQECRTNGQPLTFAGVNAHHQNGIAERRIRELQELTRTLAEDGHGQSMAIHPPHGKHGV